MHRHFTATAFVVDSKGRTLLLWHKRLQRWMPPGGHVDADEIPEEAALRECKEETGLDVELIREPQIDLFYGNVEEGRMLARPYALLLEEIPQSAERNEPAHQHMDFLYVVRPLDESQALQLQEEEGHELKWFTRAEIDALHNDTEIYANVKRYLLQLLPEKN